MDPETTKKELCIMISHYLKEKNPDIYSKLRDFYSNTFVHSDNDMDLESILRLRYANFPPNQFLLFLKTLTPKDDYPSLFRRMSDFSRESEFSSSKSNVDLLGRKKFHEKSIFSIEIDPLSRFFITGSDDCSIKIISLPFFKEIATLSGHTNYITTIYINNDVSLLLSASNDSTIRLWSLNTGKCLSVLHGFTKSIVHCSIFSPNGQFIAAACEDGILCIWTIQDALQMKPPFFSTFSPKHAPVLWLSFSPGSEFLAYVSEPNCIFVLSMSTRRIIDLKLHTGKVTSVMFSRRLYPTLMGMAPKLLTYSVDDGIVSISVPNGNTFTPILTYKPQISCKKYHIKALTWDFDEHLVIIVRSSNITVFDTISGNTVTQLPEIPETFKCYMVAANPKYPCLIAFGSKSGIFSVWDIHNSALLDSYRQSDEFLYQDLQWSPCGRFLITSEITTGNVLLFGFTFNGNKYSLVNLSDSNSQSNILNFQVHFDTSFGEQCRKEETELSQIMGQLGTNEVISPNRNMQPVNIPKPPDRIALIYRPPFNPCVLLPTDDPKQFENVNQLDNLDQQFLFNQTEAITDGSTTTTATTTAAMSRTTSIPEDLDSIAFYSDNEITPIKPPKDPSNFVAYEPFLKFNKPRWMIAISTTVFVPQVGDQVFYIHSANDRGIIDNEITYQFPSISRCIITDIEFPESNNNDLILSLRVDIHNQVICFKVNFSFNEHCDFLFPLSVMPTFLQYLTRLQIGHHIEYKANALKCIGEVLAISQDAQINPYQSITVNSTDVVMKISPWQLMEIDGIAVCNPYIGNDRSSVIAKTVDSFANIVNYQPFYTMDKEIQTYLGQHGSHSIIRPVDMKFIIERLSYGWYRSAIALENDINAVAEISRKIFEGNHEVLQNLEEMIAKLIDMILRKIIHIS